MISLHTRGCKIYFVLKSKQQGSVEWTSTTHSHDAKHPIFKSPQVGAVAGGPTWLDRALIWLAIGRLLSTGSEPQTSTWDPFAEPQRYPTAKWLSLGWVWILNLNLPVGPTDPFNGFFTFPRRLYLWPHYQKKGKKGEDFPISISSWYLVVSFSNGGFFFMENDNSCLSAQTKHIVLFFFF